MAYVKLLESLACWLYCNPSLSEWRQQKFKVILNNTVEFQVSLD